MQLSRDTQSRAQLDWLALHAVLLVPLGSLILNGSWEDVIDWQVGGVSAVAFAGGWGMILSGLSLLASVLVRRRRPFVRPVMAFTFWILPLLEAVFVAVMGGLVLDDGTFAVRLALGALGLNLLVLGFVTL